MSNIIIESRNEMDSIVLTYNSDSEVIRDYCENNSQVAANTFVRTHQKFVFSTAMRYLKNREDAEDASQEVFIKALRNLKNFRGDSNIKTWLYRITSNLCSNILRKQKLRNMFSYGDDREDFYDIADGNISAQKKLEIEEFENKFLNSLNELPKKQRETFALRYFEEMTYEEISGVLGTSVGGLKANYFQAVKKLSKYLKDDV